MNLLLIDDDAIDRINTKRALKQSGHPIEVIETSQAEEGLKLAEQHTFDLILLDYRLPGMTGLEMLKVLRNSTPQPPAVVMLSHSEDEDLAIECIEAGAQDFVPKSEVTASRLIRAILHAKERNKIEQQLRDSREKLRSLAEVDVLTGLANRYMFELSLKNALPLSGRQGKSLALIILDLDKFKNINDTLGHAAGDQLLKLVSDRLQQPLRDGDLLCRLGGDEFAILVHDLRDISLIRRLIQRIFDSLKDPFYLDGCKTIVSASIGIASYPECASDPSLLMRYADIAMYRSKESGRNQSHFYSEELHQQIMKRVGLERDLHNAIEHNQFVLHYQLQVDSKTERYTGIEALIRWNHPTRGLIYPDEFIPIAEEMKVIDKVGAWVLEKACETFQGWQHIDDHFSLAINLSALQLCQCDFLQNVKQTLNKYYIAPQRLELELTESTLNKNTEAAQLLRDLSDMGIKLALDDFGTGYSSMSQLQKYPFQVLKIDKTFIQSIIEKEDASFLEAINAFSQKLGLQVVAEGVETEIQKSCCKNLQIDRIQGYYFAKPIPAEELETQLLDYHAIPPENFKPYLN